MLHRPVELAALTGQMAPGLPGKSLREAAHSSVSSEFFAVGQLCSHIVNTNSQIGTIQDSYLALSCPVKSDLAALPAPATPPNSFLFCTHSLSTSNFQPPDSPRVSIFAFQVWSNSFICRFYAESLAISFIYRIYANHRGVPLKEKK